MAGQKLKTGLGADGHVLANGIHKELLSELKREIYVDAGKTASCSGRKSNMSGQELL